MAFSKIDANAILNKPTQKIYLADEASFKQEKSHFQEKKTY